MNNLWSIFLSNDFGTVLFQALPWQLYLQGQAVCPIMETVCKYKNGHANTTKEKRRMSEHFRRDLEAQNKSVPVQDGSFIVNEECYQAVLAPAQGLFPTFCAPTPMGPSPFEGLVIMPYMLMAYPAQYCNYNFYGYYVGLL